MPEFETITKIIPQDQCVGDKFKKSSETINRLMHLLYSISTLKISIIVSLCLE